MNSPQMSTEEILLMMRARAQVNPSPPPVLSELRQSIAACENLRHAVSTINPRRPGPANAAIQFVKKLMQRSWAWHFRPLDTFLRAVTRTLDLTASSLERIQARIATLEADFQAQQASLEQQIRASYGSQSTMGSWFNEPLALRDMGGRIEWTSTNEQIIEKAWILRHLGDLPAGSRILDIGSVESSLALELASNGFRVTATDYRDYPLRHPNLEFLRADFCRTPLESETYDLIISLSTVEHIGIGFYGDPSDSSEEVAMKAIYRLLKPGGKLLITVPFGQRAATPLHRIYDSIALRALLQDFEIQKLEFGVKTDEKTWVMPVPEEKANLAPHNQVTYLPQGMAAALCRKS